MNAKTNFGRVVSTLPITSKTAGKETIVGTINGGGCRLDLTDASGSITIQ